MLLHLIDSFFLPLLILAGCAVLCAKIYGNQDEKRIVWGAAVLFFLMLISRLCVAGSSRYYLSLYFPLLILTGFGILLLERCRLFHFRHWGICVLAFIIVICAVKSFRPAPYRKAYMKTAQVVEKDAKLRHNGVLLCFADDDKRFAYYSHLPVLIPPGDGRGYEVSLDEFSQHGGREFRYAGKTFYYIRPENRDVPPLSKENLRLPQEDDWQMISAMPVNRSGRRELRCYRYTPRPRAVSASTGEQLIKNGDFQRIAQGKEHQNVISRIRTLAPDYFDDPKLAVPAEWIILRGSNTPQKMCRIKTEVSPGLQGMILSTDIPILLCSGTSLPMGQYHLAFSLRAQENSEVILKIQRQKLAGGSSVSSETLVYLPLSTNEEINRQIPISVSEWNGEKFFSVAVLLQRGSIVLKKMEIFRSAQKHTSIEEGQ